MLKMQAIKKIYRTDMIETHALRDFDLEVQQGEFVAVTGTIVMVTHDPDLARRAHRNIQIVDGQVTNFQIYDPRTPRTTETAAAL